MPGTRFERTELLLLLGKIGTLKWELASLTSILVEMERIIHAYSSTNDANIPDSILEIIIGSVAKMERVSPILNGLTTQYVSDIYSKKSELEQLRAAGQNGR
jgi:hypothetical protein